MVVCANVTVSQTKCCFNMSLSFIKCFRTCNCRYFQDCKAVAENGCHVTFVTTPAFFKIKYLVTVVTISVEAVQAEKQSPRLHV